MVCALLGNISEKENTFIKFRGNYSNFKAEQLWSLKTTETRDFGPIAIFHQSSSLPAPSSTSLGHNTKMKYIFTNYALTNFIFHNCS